VATELINTQNGFKIKGEFQ